MNAPFRTPVPDRLLRLAEVIDAVGLSKAMIYRKMREGSFPQSCKAGCSTRWSENEVQAWIAEQLSARLSVPLAA